MAERMSRQPEITLRDDVALVLAGLGGSPPSARSPRHCWPDAAAYKPVTPGTSRQWLWRAPSVTVERTKQGSRWQVVQRDSTSAPGRHRKQAFLWSPRLPALGLRPFSFVAGGARQLRGRSGRSGRQTGTVGPTTFGPTGSRRCLGAHSAPAGDTSLSSERMIRQRQHAPVRLPCRHASSSTRFSCPPRVPSSWPQRRYWACGSSTLETIRRRVFARYPEAAPLPGPTELKPAQDAGLDVKWDGAKRAFVTQFSAGVIRQPRKSPG